MKRNPQMMSTVERGAIRELVRERPYYGRKVKVLMENWNHIKTVALKPTEQSWTGGSVRIVIGGAR